MQGFAPFAEDNVHPRAQDPRSSLAISERGPNKTSAGKTVAPRMVKSTPVHRLIDDTDLQESSTRCCLSAGYGYPKVEHRPPLVHRTLATADHGHPGALEGQSPWTRTAISVPPACA
jgi:hypothetical protein